MLQITPHHTLLLAVNPVDFRRGIDGLAALCRQVLDSDPFGGSIFIFTNKRRGSIKILVFDGNGFWLVQKRFSRGRLAWWPSHNTSSSSYPLNPSQLQILLSQGDPTDTQLPPDWRPLTPQGKARPTLPSLEGAA